MKIYVHIFAECTPLLLFFNQKNQKFTITYNDDNSYNLGLVKCVFRQDLKGNSSQILVFQNHLKGLLTPIVKL